LARSGHGECLTAKKAAILKRWREAIVGSYAPEAGRLLRDVKDRFANPVGYAIERRTEELFDEVAGAMDEGRLDEALDELLRIRSVQEFTPSQAVGFIFELKRAIREALGEGAPAGVDSEVEKRIDRLALMAFDVYSRCREEIHDVRLREVKRSSEFALRAAGAKPARGPEVNRPGAPENRDAPAGGKA
jgi:hypothetical protein